MATVAITGVTGHLGGQVARLLADLRPRLLVRDPTRLTAGDVRRAPYADLAACRDALAGVDTVLMVSASESATRRDEHRAFIEAARQAGVGHLVYTSFVGAAPDATFTLGRDHFDAESAIAASGIAATILRDNFYADLLPYFADEAGVIRGPAGSGRVAAVARADVAEVAAAVLRTPSAHVGAVYSLTGPEALTMTEVAARAGAALGRRLSYVEETEEEAYASRRAGWPDAQQWQLDAWVSTYTAIRDDAMSAVSDDVARLTGRPARTLEQALAG